MPRSIILGTDSYKVGQHKQYVPGLQYLSSYFEQREPRDGVFFGLQGLLQTHFLTPINMGDIHHARWFFQQHFGREDVFNEAGWMHILQQHKGLLPVEIIAVPEGTVHQARTPLFTIRNTCPECAWVTNYMETLLVQVWYPCTVATYSREVKKIIADYLDHTGTMETLPFRLHDFGYRGVSSYESAGIGAAAHLVNFQGTDTMAGIEWINRHYWNPLRSKMWGFSVPAAEHSTITSFGRDNEADAYKHMLQQFPGGIVSVVSDSYDIFNAVENVWGKTLKDNVVAHGGTVVIRPDSGDPAGVCVKVIELLGEAFGFEYNDKSYKVLPDYVRIIQGDGTDIGVVGEILEAFRTRGWSADNITFGMGGGLLQKQNRDELGYTLKASSAVVDGQERDISKSPVTAPWKRSKAGVQSPPGGKTVFYNGKMVLPHVQDFETIRERAAL